MNQSTTLAGICRAMTDPAFYPHPVSGIELRETHISAVFLTGDRVYKLKKPKNFGFLDFRNLADRAHFCRQELALNQRLSTDIYLEVIGIYEDAHGQYTLEPHGGPVEYAVVMRQLPDASSLAAMLDSGRVTPDHIHALGRTLAGFHRQAQQNAEIDQFGSPDVIRFNMEENFEQIEPFVDTWLNRNTWDFVRQVWRAYWRDHHGLLQRRVEDGRIRDGHGDLRAEHVYFHHGVQIIDCIEFNQRFRFGDTALDLSFLLMDLDSRGHQASSRALAAVWARESCDPRMYGLLDFYAAYRALVRLKVACLSLDQSAEDSRDRLQSAMTSLLRLASLYALTFGRPTLWIFCGLPASGKSTLAQGLADSLDLPLFRSDTVRDKDSGQTNSAALPFNTGMYRFVLRGRVYARLFNLAQDKLRQGRSVVLDATFSAASWRQAAVCLAQDTNAGLIFVECHCPDTITQARLAQRETGESESDARLMHFEDLRASYEPFPDELQPLRIRINTAEPVETCLFDLLQAAHALKREQAEALRDNLEQD